SVGLPTSVVSARVGTARVTPQRWETTIPSDEGGLAVRLYAAPLGDGRTVVTGVAFDDQRATLDALGLDLVLALPIAALLALLTGWYVGGAALHPVDRMRAEAAAISASEPERRLPVPATRDELATLGTSLNAMLDRLEAASHELRTPLANLKAELDLALRRARTQPELEAALRSAADETDRLARLAADLLVLARADRGRLPVHVADVDVAALASEAAA